MDENILNLLCKYKLKLEKFYEKYQKCQISVKKELQYGWSRQIRKLKENQKFTTFKNRKHYYYK